MLAKVRSRWHSRGVVDRIWGQEPSEEGNELEREVLRGVLAALLVEERPVAPEVSADVAADKPRSDYTAIAEELGELVIRKNPPFLTNFFPESTLVAAAQLESDSKALFKGGTKIVQALVGALDLLVHWSGAGDSADYSQLAHATGPGATGIYNQFFLTVMDGVDKTNRFQSAYEAAAQIAHRSGIPNKVEALSYLRTVRMFVVSDPSLPTGARLEITRLGTVVEGVNEKQRTVKLKSPRLHGQWMAHLVLLNAGCVDDTARELANLRSDMGSLGRTMAEVVDQVASADPLTPPSKAELSAETIADWLDKADFASQAWLSARGHLPFYGFPTLRSRRSPIARLFRKGEELPSIPEIKLGDLMKSVQVLGDPSPGDNFGLS